MPLPQARTSGKIRAAMFYAFAQELEGAAEGEISPQAFAEAVKDAIDDYGVEAGAICSEFGVTRATASRWRSGDATPGTYLRKRVVEWLAEQVAASAAAQDVERPVILQLVKVAETL